MTFNNSGFTAGVEELTVCFRSTARMDITNDSHRRLVSQACLQYEKSQFVSHNIPDIIESCCLTNSAASDKFIFFPQWGTADTEIRVPSAENPELSKVILSLKPGVGQNIALCASPTARISAFLISTFSFLPNDLQP